MFVFYVLDFNCYFIGGFVVYFWFDSFDLDFRGDWVFIIGGYYCFFKLFVYYFVFLWLGISWFFSSCISIMGEVYFVVIFKMCMGGGCFDVIFWVGLLWVWFNVYVDFLINYKFFYFIVEGGVFVGVEGVIDFCFVFIIGNDVWC